ncbi:MAG TPA: hypothetical protein VG165_08050 [Solirubrobacteraceae bacterium]|nr:hypothetical protein [Solirubrobacteraceae bacterium]
MDRRGDEQLEPGRQPQTVGDLLRTGSERGPRDPQARPVEAAAHDEGHEALTAETEPAPSPLTSVASRRLAGAAALALAATALAGCGIDSPSLDVPAHSGVTGALTPAPASGVPSSYTGLGSHAQAFARGHREAAASAAAKAGKGPVVSSIATDAAGRVIAYLVTFNFQPPLTDLERLASAVAIGDLPADRITVKSTATCLVYASPTMKQLVGMLYASVVTIPGSSTAQVRTTPTATC